MNRLSHTLLCTIIVLFFYTPSVAKNNYSILTDGNPSVSATEIKARILKKAGVFDLRYTEEVHKNIENYTIRGRNTTKRIIARSQIYFPLIEKYLVAYKLPEELKYLTIIESSMNPNAISRAGAVGLWQLIPTTARRYGLIINNQIDERRDPHKATQAALKYLTFLHKLLGDWTLAAAAYNCGGGGVQKAMRLGGGNNFWAIKSHFPKQTQDYIGRLASAIYVMNYHHHHGLKAADTEYFMKFTKVATIYNQISFQQISQALDIPIPMLQKLNPSYRKQVLPDSTKGNYLVLPKMKMEPFIDYYNNIVAGEKGKKVES